MNDRPESHGFPDDPRSATGSPGSLSSDNPEEIRVEIVQTRTEMSETLNAIQQRLDPDRLKAQARDEVEQIKERVKDELRDEFEKVKERVKHDVRDEVDHLKEELHDATIGKAEQFMREVDYQAREASSSLLDRVRANPIPTALVGFGLAWLFMSGPHAPRSSSSRRSVGEGGYGRRFSDTGYRGTYGDNRGAYGYDRSTYGDDRGAYGYEPGMNGYGRGWSDEGQDVDRGYGRRTGRGPTQQVGDTVSNVADQARDQVGQVVDQVQDLGGQVQDRVQQVGDQVQNQVQQVGQQVQQLGDQVQDQVSNVSDQVQDRFQDWSGDVVDEFTRARWMAERAMRENPLAVGVVAVALGAAVGMMVPETSQEEHLLGGARQQFMQRAGAVAQDALENVQEKVQHVASEADQAVNSMAANASKSSGQPSGASSSGQSGSSGSTAQSSGSASTSPASGTSSGSSSQTSSSGSTNAASGSSQSSQSSGANAANRPASSGSTNSAGSSGQSSTSGGTGQSSTASGSGQPRPNQGNQGNSGGQSRVA